MSYIATFTLTGWERLMDIEDFRTDRTLVRVPTEIGKLHAQ